MAPLAIRFWHFLAAGILFLVLGAGGAGDARVAHGLAGAILGTLPSPVVKVALDPAVTAVSSSRPDDRLPPPDHAPSAPGLPGVVAILAGIRLAAPDAAPDLAGRPAGWPDSALPRGPPRV
ncbi:hypothetical protein [Oleisolibacter albus]|uniref:hypothetical protein n=1 Tax=Oleisolibacter albus TaxID=2171757 RepID=UPI0012D817FB|nr:hypothetical protein [Oleisolibacter albus]